MDMLTLSAKKSYDSDKKKEDLMASLSGGKVSEFYGIIAENVIRLRGRMSQEELAKKAKVSRGTIINVEAGKGCRLDALFRIADALGAKPGDLCLPKERRDEVTLIAALFVDRIMELLPPKLREELTKKP
jgi:transcriptional regulator with XRE-family HTH domain